MRKKVIVVDDDYTNVSLLKLLLEMDNFNVVTCYSIADAKKAMSGTIAAFILDFYLHDESGLELLQAIREGKTAVPSGTPIVMISGDERKAEDALKAGANKFVLKPYSATGLITLLNDLTKGT